MSGPNTDEKTRLEIDWLKTVAGALAAVSSAVILSTLGVAGTIIGAAVGSIVVSLTSSIYSASLDRSRQRVKAQAAALAKVGVAQAEVRRASRRRGSDTAVQGHLAHADSELVRAQVELDELAEDQDGPSWKERLAALPWKRIALVSAALFVVAIVAITVFELIAGKPVSDFTGGSHSSGGTTFSDLGGGGGDSHQKRQAPTTPAPSGGATTTGANPSQVPTYGTTPTEAPSPSPTEVTPTPTPTEVPSSEAPSATASPTEGAS
ncbi:MAG TPA: hypothetical protein VFR99_03680 [Marmoricola sp.]|nr:hypothetical protein [Marmoricola sp.]